MNKKYKFYVQYNGDNMKIDFKKLISSILITFLIGCLFVPFVDSFSLYNELNKGIELPAIVFPIVWSILYLIMGISLYMIRKNEDYGKNSAYKIYFAQLVVNSIWTLIFFILKMYVLSFIWIILLLILVIIMVIKFYKIKKVSGLINIPYIIWLLIASYLSFSIIVLN